MSKEIKKKRNKKAQEEIAGFAIILVLLAIILIAFLGASLKKPEKETVGDYEAGNFLQSALQQTTRCEIKGEYKDIQDLIFECDKLSECENTGTLSCVVLENTLKELVEESWIVGENSPYSGYDLAILLNEQNLIGTIVEGETSENYKSAPPAIFSKAGADIAVYFTIYYRE